MMGRYWHMYDGGWTWWGMGLQMLLWIGLAVIVTLFIWRFVINSDSQRETDSALEVLKMRLAKGEITKEEFNEMKEFLK